MPDLTVSSDVDSFMAAANKAAMLAVLNITLGGAFTTSGAFTTTLTVTGNTNVTLPTSGTLAILGANTFTDVQLIPNGSVSAPTLAFANDSNTGIYSAGADLFGIATAGAARAQFGIVSGVGTCILYTASGNAVYTASGGGAQLGSVSVNASLTPYWTVTASTGNFASSNRAYTFSLGGDCTLVGDAADSLAQRRNTNAQTFRVYGTYTDASNYVRASLKSTSTLVTLSAETAGTGADNIDISITTAGTGLVDFSNQSASVDAAVASTHSFRMKIGGTEYKVLIATP